MVGQQMREADLGTKGARETELYFFWEREYMTMTYINSKVVGS